MLRWTVHSNRKPEGDINDKYHVSVAVGTKIYCFGGPYKDIDHLEVHVFNTVSLCWTKLPPATAGRGERRPEVPSMRFGHTAVLIEDFVYIWGGYWNGDFCNVLYAFDINTHSWVKPIVSGTAPEGTRNHSACVQGSLMCIYGGFNWDGRSSDIYTLETKPEVEQLETPAPTKGTKGMVAVAVDPADVEPVPKVWSLIELTPGTPRPTSSWHSATIIGTKMFVFGGRGSRNNIRVFDQEASCWLSTPAADFLPEGRAAFAHGGELYTFGGHHMGQTFSDLWSFNPQSLSWKKVEPKGKGPSLKPRTCCCVAGDRVVLFGGYDGYDTPADDVHILDLRPKLNTLCELAAVQYGLERSPREPAATT